MYLSMVIFLIRGDIMKKMMMMAAMGAVGYGMYHMYKKYNPDFEKDIMRNIRKMEHAASENIENMM